MKLLLPAPGSQGYAIRTATIGGHRALIVAAEDDAGVL
jgi:alpha-glucuronidase